MNRNQLLNLGMLSLLALIWGSSFILIKKGLTAFSPIQVASLRILIAGTILLLIGFKHIFKFKKEKFLPLLGIGLVGSGIPSILFSIAQTQVASATSGALNSLTPLFTFFIGLVVFKDKFDKNKLGGVLLGLIGALCLILFSNGQSAELNSYAFLIVLATMCYGTSVNLIKNYLQDVPSTTITLCSFLFIFPVFLPLLIYSGFFTEINLSDNDTWYAFMAIVLLAVLGTAFANVVFFRLAQRSSALFAASVTYLIPIVATIWGFVDGELISISHFLGLFLIIAGVYLVARKSA